LHNLAGGIRVFFSVFFSSVPFRPCIASVLGFTVSDDDQLHGVGGSLEERFGAQVCEREILLAMY
jgi:hypothetical protein